MSPIRIRPYPLLIGTSGCGKSALVRHFACKAELPILELSYGAWVVTGARTEPHTMEMLLQFVRRESQGVVFVDEVDKFVARTDWSVAVQQELYSILDGRLSGFADWTPEDVRKLQTGFLIIGAGTWQDVFKAGTRRLGFGGPSCDRSIQTTIERENTIPEELLFRFNSSLIELQPMAAGEMRERIEEIRSELSMPQLKASVLNALVENAIESRKNTRWLEAYLHDALRDHRNRWHGATPNPGSNLSEAASQTQAA